MNRLDKHLVEPAIPLLPGAPLAIYNIVATIFALLFLLAIVLGVWLMLREVWRNATQPDTRRETWERIRQWPTSKSDLILPVTMAYFAGIMVPMVAAMLVLPRGVLVEVISPEEFSTIFCIAFSPLLIVMIILVGGSIFDTYRDLRRRWATGTKRQRIVIATGVIAAVVVLATTAIGDFTGWDNKLWFNAE